MSSLTYADWKTRSASLPIPCLPFIDGGFADTQEGARYELRSPATGAILGDIAACSAQDVNAAVAAARAAYERGIWADLAPEERKRVLLRLADSLLDHAEEIGLLISLEMGKLIRTASEMEVPSAARALRWHAEAVDKLYGEIAPTGAGDLALVSREPLGVVAAITPWNFPLNLAMWKVAPALATGNSVVLKPARQTPLSALRLAELAHEAGVPAGVFNVVPGGGGEAGQALGRHDDVDCLVFTGSTEVGKTLLHYSAESNMKPVWLECGGKSPNLVFGDCADLEAAAALAAGKLVFNQGQVCSSNSRLLVERRIKDEFLSMLVDRVRSIEPGDPLDPASQMGALVDQEHTRRVLAYIDLGRQSADLLVGGSQRVVNNSDCFVEPTVFDNVDPDAVIAQEEIFGPVLAAIPFDDEDEAIEIANGTIYGLAASIWTNNLSRAHRVARRLRAGTVSINTIDAISPHTPFGGVKQSGTGRDLSLHSFDKYTAIKTTWIKY